MTILTALMLFLFVACFAVYIFSGSGGYLTGSFLLFSCFCVSAVVDQKAKYDMKLATCESDDMIAVRGLNGTVCVHGVYPKDL